MADGKDLAQAVADLSTEVATLQGELMFLRAEIDDLKGLREHPEGPAAPLP